MKTIFSPKYAKPLFCLTIIYVIVIITWVFVDDGFYGLRWLSVLNFLIILPFWLWLVYYDRRHQHEQELRQSHLHSLYLILAFFIIIPLCNHLPQKVAILFYDIDKWVNELKTMEVEKNKNPPNFNRFSGGSFVSMTNAHDEKDSFPVACHLLDLNECEYEIITRNNAKAIISYKDDIGYPFEYYKLIFSIQSNLISKDLDYHVALYKRSQRYVIIYLIFIQLANVFFALVSYRILWLYITQKTNP